MGKTVLSVNTVGKQDVHIQKNGDRFLTYTMQKLTQKGSKPKCNGYCYKNLSQNIRKKSKEDFKCF